MEIPHETRRPVPAWGGARAGAGRPARGPIASEPHRTRPPVSAHFPVHVTARVVPAAAGLHRGRTYRAIRRALIVSLARTDFRIVELAVRARSIELVVEADDRLALARGMQGFQVAAARHLNRTLARSGPVFPDRYRARSLVTRAAVRAVLATIGADAGTAWRLCAWPASHLLQSSDLPGSTDSAPPPRASGSSGMRYSSPSQRPRSMR